MNLFLGSRCRQEALTSKQGIAEHRSRLQLECGGFEAECEELGARLAKLEASAASSRSREELQELREEQGVQEFSQYQEKISELCDDRNWHQRRASELQEELHAARLARLELEAAAAAQAELVRAEAAKEAEHAQVTEAACGPCKDEG